MLMLELKILYVLFFIFAIIYDYAIKKNVLGDNIKHIYLFLGLKINNIRSYNDGKIFKYNLKY